MANRLDDVQPHDFVGQQAQGPAGMARRRVAGGDGQQGRFRRPVKDGRRAGAPRGLRSRIAAKPCRTSCLHGADRVDVHVDASAPGRRSTGPVFPRIDLAQHLGAHPFLAGDPLALTAGALFFRELNDVPLSEASPLSGNDRYPATLQQTVMKLTDDGVYGLWVMLRGDHPAVRRDPRCRTRRATSAASQITVIRSADRAEGTSGARGLAGTI